MFTTEHHDDDDDHPLESGLPQFQTFPRTHRGESIPEIQWQDMLLKNQSNIWTTFKINIYKHDNMIDWRFGTMEFYDFPYIGSFMSPSDEVHHFSEG